MNGVGIRGLNVYHRNPNTNENSERRLAEINQRYDIGKVHKKQRLVNCCVLTILFYVRGCWTISLPTQNERDEVFRRMPRREIRKQEKQGTTKENCALVSQKEPVEFPRTHYEQ